MTNSINNYTEEFKNIIYSRKSVVYMCIVLEIMGFPQWLYDFIYHNPQICDYNWPALLWILKIY